MKAKMHGITVKVGPAIRSLARVSPSLTIRAMAKPGGHEVSHILVEAPDAPPLAFGPEGPVWPYGGDYREVGIVWLKGLPLKVLKAFLEVYSENRVELYLGEDGEGWKAVFTALDDPEGYYTRLTIWPWGMAVKESWGELSFFDAWAIDSTTGEATYTGTVEGFRYMPIWLAQALG